jgi:metal-responsive CopG/Arc/MetJ family transcriptional regulator
MAQGDRTSFYTLDGERISLYIQEELLDKIDKAIKDYPALFESRSHFLRCAVSRELRRLKKFKPEMEINE